MSRKKADRSPRLKLLEEARRKLGRKRMIVNLDDMAKITGMSSRRMHELVKADASLPVQRHGSTGVSYEFDAAAVLDHLIACERKVMDVAQAHAERIARIAQSPIDPKVIARQGLSIQDLRALDGLSTSAMRKKMEQRAYTKTDETNSVVSAIYTLIQTRLVSRASRIDPAGRLPADLRSRLADDDRTTLVMLHDEIKEWLIADGGSKAGARGRAKSAGRGQVLR